jgi:anti-anti-sigma regulatory factor
VAPDPLQITIACDGVTEPSVMNAPLDVVVRVGTVSSAQIQQLRRVLHELVRATPRCVLIDLSGVDDVNAANVFAVVVGAARKAKAAGAVISVCSPPASLRRSFAVAGLAEAPVEDAAGYSYSYVFGTDDDAVVLAG